MKVLITKRFIWVAGILLFFVTWFLVIDIINKKSVSVFDAVISCIVAVIIAFLCELYMLSVKFLSNKMLMLKSKTSKMVFIIACSVCFILYSGLCGFGIGIFGILIGKFIVRFQYTIKDCIEIYKMMVPLGIIITNIIGILIFVILHIYFYIQKKKITRRDDELT